MLVRSWVVCPSPNRTLKALLNRPVRHNRNNDTGPQLCASVCARNTDAEASSCRAENAPEATARQWIARPCATRRATSVHLKRRRTGPDRGFGRLQKFVYGVPNPAVLLSLYLQKGHFGLRSNEASVHGLASMRGYAATNVRP
jgi:hypothetical protein